VDANEILVMKDGEIIERGSHDALLQLNGEYKSVWDIQAREKEKPAIV
jgi:ABC-type transport system involved in Fe-S cluster assembly fused permease/ATPase subunit